MRTTQLVKVRRFSTAASPARQLSEVTAHTLLFVTYHSSNIERDELVGASPVVFPVTKYVCLAYMLLANLYLLDT